MNKSNSQNHTDKQLLAKALKTLLLALPTLVLTTYLFTFAFLNKETLPLYIVLPLALIGMVATIFLFFKGLKTLSKALFNKKG